ncbi:TPA: YSIRK-type signal peptide-containing protein, partial [Streptococcus suis]
MSSKDMFRKEQRFSFRKFSFGLASAVIANVIFGGAIASSPVVHANTTTETAAVATSERIASIPYTVNIVDQTGKVVETKEKKVLVYTVETIATATEYLTADLVPEGYAIVSGLGEVTLTEKADNIFTVKVDKIAPEAAAPTTTAESATSETATPEPASLAATQSTPVTSEVAEAEVAPTTSEESAKPTERTAYLSYITHYVNEANETVDRTGHLVAVKTTDETAKTQVTVSASENMPSGWELVQDKAKVVVQLVENQTNILVFAVTKKSKEEEIAASQLSNKDVLEQVLSEGVLLSNDAARLLETSQAGNTGLEVATNNTKAVLKEAIQVFDEPTSTQEQVDAQTELVRAASKTLADELLKFDEDGVLTAMLDATTQGITVTTSSKGKVRPNYPDHIRDFATNEKQREYENQDFFFGLIGKELTEEASQISATAQGPDGSPLPVSLVGGGWQEIPERDRYGLNINNSGVIYGTTTIKEAGNTFSWRFQASSSGYETVGPQFTFVPYTVVKTDENPIRKTVTAGVTADEILAKVKSDVTRGDGSKQGPLNATFEEYFNSELTARATGTSTKVAEDAKNGKQIWHEIVGDIPTTAGTHTVTVRSTNVHGQTIDTDVVVDLYEIVKIPSSASEPAPKGYVTVTFGKHDYTRGFTLGTQTGESVKVFVKENVKWGELLDDPAWQWPTVKTDEGDTVVGWSVNDYNYKPGNAFARDKYKDEVVTNTKLYPNVVYEVEDVKNQNPTKQGFLAQYGPDEQDKWIFITFDADQGQLSGSKQSKMVAVSKNLYSIDFSNKKFKEKVESPTLQGHTFVRWQTDAGEVLPKSGEITTDTTYKALYLAHPTDKTVVFDANKLTDTEKDSLKQAINNANTDSANLIQSITVSDTGEATVTYNDGTVVTVPASHLINEDKEPARNLAKEEIDDKLAEEKAAIEAKRDAAIAEINNTPGLTDDQKQAATDAVTNTANDALTALDTAADDAKKAIDTKTTAADFNDAKTAGEKALDDAKAAGEAAINLTKDKELAKADVENQAAAAIEAIKNNPNLNEDEQAPYIDAIEKAAEEQKAAIDAAKDTVGITDAVNAAEKVNEEQKL